MIKSKNRAEIIIPSNAYYPNSEINGTIKWSLAKPPKKLDLTLFWKTSGRGDPDGDVVITLKLLKKASGEQEFTFNVPNSPYSFSGTLISLQWCLRFKAISPTLTIVKKITISTTRKEIILSAVKNQKLTKALITPA